MTDEQADPGATPGHEPSTAGGYQPDRAAGYQPGAASPPVVVPQTAPQAWQTGADMWQTGTGQPPQHELPRSDELAMPAGSGWPGGPGEGGPGPGGGSGQGGGMQGWRRVAAAGSAAVAIALIAGGTGGAIGYHLQDHTPAQITNVGSDGTAARPIDRSSLASIAAAVQPTVVMIETRVGEGSGVITTADGTIVTNNHVVSGAQGGTVTVTFNSGRKVAAKILGTDPKTDLAVVKAQGVSGLAFATFANSDAVRVGDTVLAIGSPLGLQGSVTAGIVSALHRTITVSDQQGSPFTLPGDQQASTTIGDAIQTDAPINPGNSGGALVNTDGQVIGINSAIQTAGSGSGNIGVGFAISSNKVKAVTDQLIKGGKVSHPYLGVRVTDADTGGAQVASVEQGSPADKAGLKVGDVVTRVNNTTIANSADLVAAVQAGKVGTTLRLSVTRGGKPVTVSATLGESPN
jgi:putative serine protease PepD